LPDWACACQPSRPAGTLWVVWWASSVCGVHGALFLSHPRLKPPVAFCKQPHLNKPGITARLCEKKYDPSAARVEIFFQQTRRAPALTVCPGLSELCYEKAIGELSKKLNSGYKSLTGGWRAMRAKARFTPMQCILGFTIIQILFKKDLIVMSNRFFITLLLLYSGGSYLCAKCLNG